VIGGAIVYAVMRWGLGLLPSVNPQMAFVPQTAFFLAHLLFGLVAARSSRSPSAAAACPARPPKQATRNDNASAVSPARVAGSGSLPAA
jgi:hypothetical protein